MPSVGRLLCPRPSRITGEDLRLLRLARRLTAAEVGRRLGVSRARVRYIEQQRGHTRELLQRYLDAIEAGE